MSSILNRAFYPLILTATVLGVQMIQYRSVRLGYAQFVISWCLYFVIVHHLWCVTNVHELFYSLIFRMIMLAIVFCCLITTLLALLYKTKFQGCLDDLASVDENLQYLGISKEYSNLRKSIERATIIWFVGWTVLLSIDLTWLLQVCGTNSGILILLTMNYPSLINSVSSLLMCEVLSCVGWRFDRIISYIKVLMDTNDLAAGRMHWSQLFFSTRIDRNFKATKKKQSMWIVMRMHRQLCKIARLINAIFGVQLTLEFTAYFVNAVSIIVAAYGAIFFESKFEVQTYRVIVVGAWSSMYITRLIYINHVFDSVSYKATDSSQFIYKYLNSVYDQEDHREIVQFVLYMIYRPLTFKGLGAFQFGSGFLLKFFTGTVGVTVIILQTRVFYQKIILNDLNGHF